MNRPYDAPASQTSVPQDFEAEQAVLGAIIDDNKCLIEVAEILSPESFYSLNHHQIFKAMLKLDQDKKPIDEVLIGDELKRVKMLGQVGGYAYLAELEDLVPSTGHVVQYANIVQEHEVLRDMIDLALQTAKHAQNPACRPDMIHSQTSEKMRLLAEKMAGQEGGKLIFKQEKFAAHYHKFDVLSKLSFEERLSGVRTGYHLLDKMIGGLEDSNLIVLAARPAMGKTALAINIILHVLKEWERRLPKCERPAVVFYSLEMSDEEITDRFLSLEGKVDGEHIRDKEFVAEEWDRLAMATDVLSAHDENFYVDDRGSLPVQTIRADAHRKNRSHPAGIGLVVVDYIQLCVGSTPGQMRESEVSEITRELKTLAKELKCPVLALSQLNRKPEERTNKRPLMSDLRESGSIEQDANKILFIYRDEVYDENTDDKGIAEIIVGKARNGRTGTAKLSWQGKFAKFSNLSSQDDPY